MQKGEKIKRKKCAMIRKTSMHGRSPITNPVLLYQYQSLHPNIESFLALGEMGDLYYFNISKKHPMHMLITFDIYFKTVYFNCQYLKC
jgi:hypothetical protein